MTKLLMTISGLAAVSVSSLSIFSNAKKCEVINTNQVFAESVQWKITDPQELKQTVKADEWLYFAIDNINLSSMGISDIDKLHEYNAIEIPDFFIRFFGKKYIDIKGDIWETERSLGSENWDTSYWEIIDNVTMTLQRASTIWINESNELMMRLAYHASLNVVWPPEDPTGGLIAFKSGSVINFY